MKPTDVSPDNWTRFARGLPQGSTALRAKYLLSSGSCVRITPGVPRATLTGLEGLLTRTYQQLICNHPAKSDGGVGNASRGSGALPAFVDFILEFRLYDPEHADDPKRRLSCVSRFDESRRELVLELTAEGYRGVGTRAEAKREDRLPLLIGLLPNEPPGLKANKIRTKWNSKDLAGPGLPTLKRDLAAAVEAGTVTKLGKGVRGDPNRYYSNHLGVYTEE